MRRREFLRKAGVVAAGAAAGSVLGWPARARAIAPPIGVPPPLASPYGGPIDHVIVLMMENRSFDHYFGWRTGTNLTYPAGRNTLGDTHHLGGDYRGCAFGDPGHGWSQGRAQRDGGFLAPGSGNDELAIGYYLPDDVEFYTKLIRQFTLCDNYYCSLLGPTFPNREYMHSAQSGGVKDNSLPSLPGFEWETIWDRCEAAGVPWGYYFVDLPAAALWGPRLAKGIRHVEHFYADALLGTLPNVVFVDPGFTTGLRTDEHPFGDIRAGQAYVHDVVKAVLESPLWGRTAMFLNYDEWGGFFDHLPPPRTNADLRATPDDPGGEDDFGQMGFRVPCTIISPYSRQNVLSSEIVSGRIYDHTSILKYIETLFGLAPLTPRDAAAANIGELLDLTQAPIDPAGIVELLPRIPLTSLPCPGEELEGLPIPKTVSAPKNSFDVALESGVFERLGYKIDLKPFRNAFA